MNQRGNASWRLFSCGNYCVDTVVIDVEAFWEEMQNPKWVRNGSPHLQTAHPPIFTSNLMTLMTKLLRKCHEFSRIKMVHGRRKAFCICFSPGYFL